MRLTILIGLLIVLMSFAQAATLIDSDDFENYTTATLISGGGGKWNCSNPVKYPSCVTTNGATANAAFLIDEYLGNKYLRLYVMNDSDHVTPCREVALTWNFNNYLSDASVDHSIKFKLNIKDDEFSTWLGFNRYLFWRFNEVQGDVFDGTTWYGYTTGTNDTFARNLRLVYDGVNYASGMPCYPNINTWNNYVMYYESNGTDIINKTLYKNGVMCAYNDSVFMDDFDFPLTEFVFEVQCGVDVGIDDIKVYSGLAPLSEEGCTTNCTTYEYPYYLKEYFNGYIDMCDWNVAYSRCYNGTLEYQQSDPPYWATKIFEPAYDTDTRYVTIDFDVKPSNLADTGWISVGLYDENYQRYVQFSIDENGSLYNNEDGDVNLLYRSNNTGQFNIMLHIDFTDDQYDLYYNGGLINASLEFSNIFLNAESLGAISIASKDAGYELDNLEIYATDQNNNIILPSVPISHAIPNESISMCGIFYRDARDITCSADSDCPTDSCLPNGHCNTFDMNYCDENGKTRGNYCFISAVMRCALDSLANIILDNFLLFLVFLIVVILIAYLIYMARGR